ncbi:hypothetical protein [Thermococcus sp.]|uniref:hypothetical protein n=1 Tax=Thermococcus sp. TaxID=35749 RepID=UPI002615595F|nr:hypothetical protein [Thermococcus sp.]
MAIPRNIIRKHVLNAILEINEHGVPGRFRSLRYSLVHNGREYPPKYVVSIANRYANGELLDPSKFTTQDALRYLTRLGFQIEERVENGQNNGAVSTTGALARGYPADGLDRRMYGVFEKFAFLVETRLRAILEGRSQLDEIYRESEDTMRYMMFHALTIVGRISPTEVYLEYPHPEVPNRNHAKLDTFVAPKGDRPAIAFEMKFHRKIGNNELAKPNNAGAVFADVLKLALFRPGANIKRYLVYIADGHMLDYLSNPRNKYEPFINLEENTGFDVTREYLLGKTKTFKRELRRVVGEEEPPEPTVICRFKRNLLPENRKIAIRLYEVVPENKANPE